MRRFAKAGPVLGALILTGCAGHRAEPFTATAPTASAATTPAAVAPLRSASTGPAADKAGTGVDLALVKRGFRARQKNGQLKYCRTQVLTGTHFSNTICYTADEIRVQDANTKTDLDLVKRQGHSPCPNNKCD